VVILSLNTATSTDVSLCNSGVGVEEGALNLVHKRTGHEKRRSADMRERM